MRDMIALSENEKLHERLRDMTARNERLGNECVELIEQKRALRYRLALHELRSKEWGLIVRTNDALLTHAETTVEEVKLLRAVYDAAKRCVGRRDAAYATHDALDAIAVVADFDSRPKPNDNL